MEDADLINAQLEIQRLPEAGLADLDPSGAFELVAAVRPRVEAAGLELRTLTFGEAERLFPQVHRRRIPLPSEIRGLLDHSARILPPKVSGNDCGGLA